MNCISAEIKREGMNNCLFLAVITATDLRSVSNPEILADPQALRNACKGFLEEEKMPIFADGTPAGEGYLQILSKMLRRKIIVYKNRVKVAEIVHSDWERVTIPSIHLTHIGPPEAGHWVSTTAPL